MIAFHPDDLDLALGVGELADGGEELPVVLGEAGEVEVGEDVAEEDELRERLGVEQVDSVVGPADP